MLAKKYRLPVQSVLRKNGRTYRGPYFFIKKYPPALAYSRYSVVVANKVAPLSTARSYIKRLYYRAIRPLMAETPPGDYLITAMQAPYESLPVDAIIKELKKGLL